jgi:hypothetical protein
MAMTCRHSESINDIDFSNTERSAQGRKLRTRYTRCALIYTVSVVLAVRAVAAQYKDKQRGVALALWAQRTPHLTYAKRRCLAIHRWPHLRQKVGTRGT